MTLSVTSSSSRSAGQPLSSRMRISRSPRRGCWNWRGETFYSRSLDPTDITGSRILDSSVNREYFTVATQVVGPVFSRVWNTPDNGYAERFKHTIEPYFNVQRTSSIDNYNRIRIDALTASAAGNQTLDVA